MKRILVLILAVGLILGLSATAFAAGESITFSGSSTSTVAYDGNISITGTIDNYDGSASYSLTCDNSNDITLSGNSFTCRANASNFSPGTNVTFTFTLTNDSDSTFVNPKPAFTVSIQAAPQKSSDNFLTYINISNVGSKSGPPESGFSFTAPSSVTSIQASSISTTVSDKASAQICNSNGAATSSISLGAVGNATTTTFIVRVTAEDTTKTRDYIFTINREAAPVQLSNDTSIGTVTLKNSSGNSIGNVSIANKTVSVPNTHSGTLNISATANHNKASVQSISPTSISLTDTNLTASFTVTIKAENGSTAAHTFSVTRAAASTTTYINSVTLKSGSTSGSTVGTAVGAVTSANISSSRSITIPASLRSTTTFYAVVALPSGTISNATISGTGTSVSRSSNNITLTIPSTTTSATLNITVPGYASAIPITINRTTTTNILNSVTFTLSGSTLGSVGTVSGNSTQSVNLNTSATSANVAWVLADGATLNTAKWNNGNVNSGASIGLPAKGATRALVLTITASNGTQYTATFNVSIDGTTTTNTLSSLYIKNRETTSTNDGYLFNTSPTNFSSSRTDYTVYVADDTDTIYVYPTPTSSGASINLDSSSVKKVTDRYSNNKYFMVDLKTSNNTVKVEVTANNTTTTYTLKIEREESVEENASLKTLYVTKSDSSSSGSNRYTLEPSFAYNKTTYDVNIPKSASEAYLHFTTYKSSADVSVKGATKVSDGVYKATLSANKTKTVTITVEYSNDETEYTINLNSGSATSNAQLTRIRVAERENNSNSYQYTLLPDFDASVTDYVALIPYESSSDVAYVQGTLKDDDNELRIDGEDVASGDWVEVEIDRGRSVSVPIRVTDDNNKTTTYNLKIVAAARNADDDAELDGLSLRTSSSTSSAISLSPSFSHNTTSYTAANVPNSTNTLRVYAEPSDSDAWVIVNNVLMTSDYATVDLDEGKNTIKVIVYAADCESNEEYTITVTRGAAGGSDSTLASLEARYGTTDGQTLNLIPAFAKNTTSYRINVDGSVAQVAFKPTTTDSTATVKIMGKDEISGQWGSYNAINNGANNFLIAVTSGDGKSTTYYTVSVERGLSVVISGQKLRVNGVDVTCAAYNINGNNYFKLRDIAFALSGTPKSFDVTYNSRTRVVSMISGRNYSIIGGEMVKPLAPGKYQLSNQSVLKDGVSVNLTAYNVDGNNYFMLREIGQLFNFGVTYDSSTSTVSIDSSKVYVPES